MTARKSFRRTGSCSYAAGLLRERKQETPWKNRPLRVWGVNERQTEKRRERQILCSDRQLHTCRLNTREDICMHDCLTHTERERGQMLKLN